VSFAEWIFLFGGLAVAGPLFAHLLAKPRYRRIPFTMLRFLRTGQMESQSRRKLRDLLILSLRCAIVVLIAMLFARPIIYTKSRPKEAKSVYYLGLDNSMSMAYADGAETYFNKLVNSTIDYIRSADDEGIFNICTLGSGDWTGGMSRKEALAEVQGLKITPMAANIGKFFSTLRTMSEKEHSSDIVSVFVLSDFTPNTLKQLIDVEKPTYVDKIDYELIVSPKPVNNAAIVSAHANNIEDGKLTISVTVANYGQIGQNRQLTANIAENKSAPVDVSLSAKQRRTYQIQIDTGTAGQSLQLLTEEQLFLPVQLSLSAGDGLREDDTFYLAVSLPQRKNVNVLLAGSGKGEMFLLKTAMNTLSQMEPSNKLSIREVSINDLTPSDLDRADIVVCSAITDRLSSVAPALKNFVESGGKTIFFMTEKPSSKAANRLWNEGVLAALPQKCIRERTHIQPRPSVSQAVDMGNIAAKSLSNYRIDKLLLTGYLECEQHPDSSCLWRLQNGSGFVYCKHLGKGAAILVNTSADDSLGSLTKSNASIAFCQYLLGQNYQIGEYCFACDEQVVLPGYDMKTPFAGRKQFWVETCYGRKRRAVLTESSLLVPNPGGIGWVKTLTKPIRYAGVNLPNGETDITRPVPEKVAKIMKRIFSSDRKQNITAAEAFSEKKRNPLWKMFAWIIILLLLVEPAVANRLKR